jgi:hypothetical protein
MLRGDTLDEAARRPRRWWWRATFVVGTLTALVLADLGLGLAWNALAPVDDQADVVVDGLNFSGEGETVADPRAQLPAMEGSPWAEEYFREVQLTPSSYWPFTESRPREFDGEFVNIEGWARASYESPEAGDDAPVVWMFGGSTTWGEGQRDEYTIPSYLARIAEAEGEPIVVENYGQRGWTHFQEMILFEQLLAAGPAPDVAVFYDGTNEINAQSLSVKGVPSHTFVEQYAELISGGVAEEFTAPPVEPGPATRAWRAYVEGSAIQRLVRTVDDWTSPSVGASTGARTQDAGGDIYVATPEDAEAAVEVYERGRAMTLHLAERAGVEPLFVWQPLLGGAVEDRAEELVSSPTVNLGDALDEHPEVFVDGAHTNERGAELVAERLWRELAPKLGRSARRTDSPASTDPDAGSTTTTVPQRSNAEILAVATTALDEALGDPCEVERWKVWLGSLRATDAAEAEQVGLLAGRFLVALAAAGQAQDPAAARVLVDMAASLPTIARDSGHDPDLPLIPQLQEVVEATTGFLRSFEEIVDAVGSSCTAQSSPEGRD